MGIFNFVKAGGKKFGSIVGTGSKVNKTELDKAKSKLAIAIQKNQGSKAKLKQTLFEIENKQPLTFKTNKEKTLSNTEKKKKADARIKEKKQETKTKHFYAPKNFNKGGRVGLKKGGGSDLGMQSVKHGIDNNPKITAADPKAKFIAAAKNKKSKKKVI